MATEEEKFIGCLLGGAIGDALGMPLVDMSREDVAELGPVRDFLPSRGIAPMVIPMAEQGDAEMEEPLTAGQWTDDTQLTLALADSLIEQRGLFIPEDWAHYLVRWLNEAPRGPDLSSLEAALQLRTGAVEWDDAADPEGAGCGPAARVAPLALYFLDDPAGCRRASILQARMTHFHPDAQAAAVAVSEAIRWAVKHTPSDLANENGALFLGELEMTVAAESPTFTEFARCLALARTLLIDNVEPETAIRILGTSAWSREAVPCALYLVARFPDDLEALLLQSVNETGGAVDSIAALTGAIGGALHGAEALPLRWRAGVEDGARLLRAATDLYALYEAKA